MEILFVILLVVFIIILMQGKEYKVNINRIWLIPALLCFVTIQSIIHMGQLTILKVLLFVVMLGIGSWSNWGKNFNISIR